MPRPQFPLRKVRAPAPVFLQSLPLWWPVDAFCKFPLNFPRWLLGDRQPDSLGRRNKENRLRRLKDRHRTPEIMDYKFAWEVELTPYPLPHSFCI